MLYLPFEIAMYKVGGAVNGDALIVSISILPFADSLLGFQSYF